MAKVSFFECTLDEVSKIITANGFKPFNAKQLWEWVYKKNIANPDEMHTLPQKLRNILPDLFTLSPFKSIQQLKDPEGNATKLILECEDGNYIEAVIIHEPRFNTLCISSQCGCPADCKFCVTGVLGFKRQLTTAEIVGQLFIAKQLEESISRIVYMGMGEPLLNIDNVLESIDAITSPSKFEISKRKITVSTVGYLAGLKKLVESNKVLNLAFSVGSALPAKRVSIMPFETRNPLTEIVQILKKYLTQHNRKLTLEYTLLKGVNDTELDCHALIQLGKYLNAKINLINLNPHEKIKYQPVTAQTIHTFKSSIRTAGLTVTVRFKRGQKIAAACGQLGTSNIADA